MLLSPAELNSSIFMAIGCIDVEFFQETLNGVPDVIGVIIAIKKDINIYISI